MYPANDENTNNKALYEMAQFSEVELIAITNVPGTWPWARCRGIYKL